MSGKVVSLYVRFGDFTGFATQKKLGHYINTGPELYTTACNLLQLCTETKPIRLVGVSLSCLIKDQAKPIPLWINNQKRILCQPSLDKIQDRYGDFTIFPASMTTILKRIATIPDGRDPRVVLNSLMKRYYEN